nr:methyltransferase domain-containing protein [Neiella marina]
MSSQQGRLCCSNGHSFDLAKQGYCHLLPVQQKRSIDPGDSKEMVKARRELLDSGAYQPVAQQLQQYLAALPSITQRPLRVADAGCGEGYYLSQVASQLSDEVDLDFIGFDISKWAVQAATKRSKAIRWLVASSKNIPIESNYLDVMLCMFGFPVFSEFARTLSVGGKLLLVDAGPQHLVELRSILYDDLKPYKDWCAEPALDAGFELSEHKPLAPFKARLTQQQIQTLALMTPHFFRAPAANRSKLASLQQLEVTLDVQFRLLTLLDKQ